MRMKSSTGNMETLPAIGLALMLSSLAVAMLIGILILPIGVILDAVGVSGRVKSIVFLGDISISISSGIYAFVKLYKYFHYGRRRDVSESDKSRD